MEINEKELNASVHGVLLHGHRPWLNRDVGQ